MNIINGFCSGMEWLRSVVFDAGTQGLGFDENHDEVPIPPDAKCLLQAPSSVQAVSDLARTILDGDFVAMSEIFNGSTGLPPLESLEYPCREVLLEVLKAVSGKRKPKGETFDIQILVLRYLGCEHVLKLTRNLPSGWGSYKIDDVLKYAQLKPVDSRSNVIEEKVWRTRFGDAAPKEQRLTFEEVSSLQNLNGLRALKEILNMFVSIYTRREQCWIYVNDSSGGVDVKQAHSISKNS